MKEWAQRGKDGRFGKISQNFTIIYSAKLVQNIDIDEKTGYFGCKYPTSCCFHFNSYHTSSKSVELYHYKCMFNSYATRKLNSFFNSAFPSLLWLFCLVWLFSPPNDAIYSWLFIVTISNWFCQFKYINSYAPFVDWRQIFYRGPFQVTKCICLSALVR